VFLIFKMEQMRTKICFSWNSLKMKMVTKATNIANNGQGNIIMHTRTMAIHGVDKIAAIVIIKRINETFLPQICPK